MPFCAPSRLAWVMASIAVLPHPITTHGIANRDFVEWLRMNFFDEIECVVYSAKLFSRDPNSLPITEADPNENRVKLLLLAEPRRCGDRPQCHIGIPRRVARPWPFRQD